MENLSSTIVKIFFILATKSTVQTEDRSPPEVVWSPKNDWTHFRGTGRNEWWREVQGAYMLKITSMLSTCHTIVLCNNYDELFAVVQWGSQNNLLFSITGIMHVHVVHASCNWQQDHFENPASVLRKRNILHIAGTCIENDF